MHSLMRLIASTASRLMTRCYTTSTPERARVRAHSPGDQSRCRTGRSVVVEATHPAAHRVEAFTGGFMFVSREAPS